MNRRDFIKTTAAALAVPFFCSQSPTGVQDAVGTLSTEGSAAIYKPTALGCSTYLSSPTYFSSPGNYVFYEGEWYQYVDFIGERNFVEVLLREGKHIYELEQKESEYWAVYKGKGCGFNPLISKKSLRFFQVVNNGIA